MDAYQKIADALVPTSPQQKDLRAARYGLAATRKEVDRHTSLFEDVEDQLEELGMGAGALGISLTEALSEGKQVEPQRLVRRLRAMLQDAAEAGVHLEEAYSTIIVMDLATQKLVYFVEACEQTIETIATLEEAVQEFCDAVELQLFPHTRHTPSVRDAFGNAGIKKLDVPGEHIIQISNAAQLQAELDDKRAKLEAVVAPLQRLHAQALDEDGPFAMFSDERASTLGHLVHRALSDCAQLARLANQVMIADEVPALRAQTHLNALVAHQMQAPERVSAVERFWQSNTKADVAPITAARIAIEELGMVVSDLREQLDRPVLNTGAPDAATASPATNADLTP